MLARIIYEDSWGDQKIEGITPGMFPVVVEHLSKNRVEMTVEFYDEYNKSTDDLSDNEIIDETRYFITELIVYGFTYLQISDPTMLDGYEADHQLYFCNDSHYKVDFEREKKYYIVRITRDRLTLKIDYINQYELLEKMQPRDCFVNSIIADNFCNDIYDKDLFDSKMKEANDQLNLELLEGSTIDRVNELIKSNFAALVNKNRYFDGNCSRYDEDSYVSSYYDEDDVLGYDNIKEKLYELIDDSFDSNLTIRTCVYNYTTGDIVEHNVRVLSIRSLSLYSLLCPTSLLEYEYDKYLSQIIEYTKITKDGQKIVRYAEVNEVHHKYPILLKAMINNDFSDFDDQLQPERVASIHIIDDENNVHDSNPNYDDVNFKLNKLIIELYDPINY